MKNNLLHTVTGVQFKISSKLSIVIGSFFNLLVDGSLAQSY